MSREEKDGDMMSKFTMFYKNKKPVRRMQHLIVKPKNEELNIVHECSKEESEANHRSSKVESIIAQSPLKSKREFSEIDYPKSPQTNKVIQKIDFEKSHKAKFEIVVKPTSISKIIKSVNV